MTITGLPTTHPRDRIANYDERTDRATSHWLPPGQREVGAPRDPERPEWFGWFHFLDPAEIEQFWRNCLRIEEQNHQPRITVRSTRLYKILCEGGDTTPEVRRGGL